MNPTLAGVTLNAVFGLCIVILWAYRANIGHTSGGKKGKDQERGDQTRSRVLTSLKNEALPDCGQAMRPKWRDLEANGRERSYIEEYCYLGSIIDAKMLMVPVRVWKFVSKLDWSDIHWYICFLWVRRKLPWDFLSKCWATILGGEERLITMFMANVLRRGRRSESTRGILHQIVHHTGFKL